MPFSPALQERILYAAANSGSFRLASEHLLHLADQAVPVKEVERLAHRLGAERVAERDARTEAWETLTLAERDQPPPGVTPPAVAVVEADGGRLQIRADAAAEATDPSGKGHWREDKVGVLLHVKAPRPEFDPRPEIPACFVDRDRALELAQQIGHAAVPAGFTPGVETPGVETPEVKTPRPDPPEVIHRTVIATRRDIKAFGPMLAAAAHEQGLGQSERRAYVADGQEWNWGLWKRFFPRYTPVLDFLHAMTYVYRAATAGRDFEVGWPTYVEWIGWVWSGEVDRVIASLKARQAEVGEATKEDAEGSVRVVVDEALTYVVNQRDRMDYPSYRREGLPVMSSHAESTIKQINARVKGTEKFWSEAGAEAMLQIRADHLSDGEVISGFFERRQANATGFRDYRMAA